MTLIKSYVICAMTVALRKESVDRNCYSSARGAQLMVALRKESVDRNAGVLFLIDEIQLSLSARRAWIEMVQLHSSVSIRPGRSPQGERG